ALFRFPRAPCGLVPAHGAHHRAADRALAAAPYRRPRKSDAAHPGRDLAACRLRAVSLRAVAGDRSLHRARPALRKPPGARRRRDVHGAGARGLVRRRMDTAAKSEDGGPHAPHSKHAGGDADEHMLTEARVLLPGAQAMLGFQLAVLLTESFTQLPESAK